jgi:hypothetical protein
MKTQIFQSHSDFLDNDDQELNGVSPEFAETHPDYEKANESNRCCWNCSDCSDFENIHQKVFEAASKPNALNMGDWHTCETTHCRAGWVTHLAGPEGKALEQRTTTTFAAMQIYKASSPIRVFPSKFFVKDKEALEDMQRCAELEAPTVKDK